MDPNPYPELRHSAYAYEGLGSPQSLAIDLDFEPYPLPNQNRRSLASHHVPTGDPPGILANQRTTTYNPAGFFTTRDDWYQHMTVSLVVWYINAANPVAMHHRSIVGRSL